MPFGIYSLIILNYIRPKLPPWRVFNLHYTGQQNQLLPKYGKTSEDYERRAKNKIHVYRRFKNPLKSPNFRCMVSSTIFQITIRGLFWWKTLTPKWVTISVFLVNFFIHACQNVPQNFFFIKCCYRCQNTSKSHILYKRQKYINIKNKF